MAIANVRIASLLSALSALLLVGCTPGLKAIGDSLLYAARPDRRVNEATLSPDFEYLRVRVNGRLAILALGAFDSFAGRSVQVFFSGEGETLKLLDGRILEFSAPGQHIRFNPPVSGFPEFRPGLETTFNRTTDTRPSYAFSVPQTLRLAPLDRPPRKTDLAGIDPRSLIWFEEQEISGLNQTSQTTMKLGRPRARYAVLIEGGRTQIVYSEQCISPDLCLSLQRWRATGSY